MKTNRIIGLLVVITIFISSVKGQADYISSYYPQIYKAENAIVENNLPNALTLYRSTFKSVNRVFAIDVVNATVCAIKLDSQAIAFEFLHKLILKGISEEFLSEFKGFEELRDKKQWSELLAKYDSIQLTVQYNDKLNDQLDSLSAIDQKFRIAQGSYSKYGDTIAKIDKSNVLFFRQVISIFGYPNEHIFGTKYPSIGFPGSIVLHHYCQSMSLDSSGSMFNFETDFINAIKNGELDPHRMAQLIRMQGKYAPEIGQNCVYQLSLNGEKTVALREKISPDNISIFEENRANFGLESLDSYFYKANFALFHPRAKDFNFIRYTITQNFDCDEETYNKLLNAFEPINQ